MKLDRDLQLTLLTRLAETFPEDGRLHELAKQNELVTPNLAYLKGHGLIEGEMTKNISGANFFLYTKITSDGLDFLEGDGGLSAILGVVTVKLHDDTIRHLIAAKIEAADIPPSEKIGLLGQLRGLQGDAIKHLTMKLLDVGLESWPAVLRAIQMSQ